MCKIVKTVTEYIDCVRSLTTYSDHLLFRGQTQDWPLIPSVGRSKASNGEENLICDFKTGVQAYVDLSGLSEWDIWALAQHHELRTRYLDWSLNALAALWFAMMGKKADQEEDKECKQAVVWVLSSYKQFTLSDDQLQSIQDPLSLKQSIIYQPKAISPRIVAQQGLFSIHVKNESGEFVPLEEQYQFRDELTKLVIPYGTEAESNAFDEMRNEINSLGANGAVFYPDIDGLCQHLNWLHSKDRNYFKLP